ncbi:MAG: hypothetical protein ACNS64_02040 [Candidatus Halalkalibacterium sp. M3_1C_030]
MKLSTYLISLLLLFLYTPLHAQDNDIDENDWREWTRGAKMVKTTAPNEIIEGTPYFNPEWTKGRAQLRSNNKTKEILLRYNANSNELEFKKDDKILIAIPRMVISFTLLNEENEKVSFKSGFKSQEHDIYPGLFLRVIHDGKVKLVVHHKTEFMKAHSINPLTGKKVSKYIPKSDHFLITEDGKYHDIKLKRKHILRALNQNEDELKNFAKSNDLDFGNENDLAKILAYYESL